VSGIVIDIDGVVADSEKYLVKHIEKSSGKKLTFTNPRTFQFSADIPTEDLVRYIEEAIILYKEVIKPCDPASTYIALLILEKKFGVVNFLSARSSKTEEATRWWLDKNFPKLNYNLMNLGEDKRKVDWMRETGFDTIVEDRFKTANECDFDNGYTFLINQPWNAGRREWGHVNRVNNLYQAVEKYLRWLRYDLTREINSIIL